MTTGRSINDADRSLPLGHGLGGDRVFEPEPRRRVEAGAFSGAPPQAKVADIMTRNVRSCRPESTLAAAAIAMFEADCRFLPVVSGDGRPIGVVTDGDICLLGSTSHRRLSDMYVKDAMSGQPASCRAGEGVLAALKRMREHRIRHLPVVGENGRLEGVVSLTDVVLCAEEEGSDSLRRELTETLRTIVQKRGDRRVIVENPFVEE